MEIDGVMEIHSVIPEIYQYYEFVVGNGVKGSVFIYALISLKESGSSFISSGGGIKVITAAETDMPTFIGDGDPVIFTSVFLYGPVNAGGHAHCLNLLKGKTLNSRGILKVTK